MRWDRRQVTPRIGVKVVAFPPLVLAIMLAHSEEESGDVLEWNDRWKFLATAFETLIDLASPRLKLDNSTE